MDVRGGVGLHPGRVKWVGSRTWNVGRVDVESVRAARVHPKFGKPWSIKGVHFREELLGTTPGLATAVTWRWGVNTEPGIAFGEYNSCL